MLAINTIHTMDCLQGLKMLPDGCIQCCVTSPPYFQQRDYGMEGQYGTEESPEQYVQQLAVLFTEVRRVLKDDGLCWLNLGDGYWGSGKAGSNPDYQKRHTEFGRPSQESSRFGRPTTGKHPEIKAKDLIGIPWSVAFALRQQGWYLRQDIIWHKPNGMPESITDRCTRNHEYIFMLAKSPRYYYDAEAIKTIVKDSSLDRYDRAISDKTKYRDGPDGQSPQNILQPRPNKQQGHGIRHDGFNARYRDHPVQMANRRSVWTISPKPLKEKHFAAFPIDIPMLCIKASTRERDLVLDPFMGAGTTALAAATLNRQYIGFELNPAYTQIANKRLWDHLGLFNL